jgi:hypothetical protein
MGVTVVGRKLAALPALGWWLLVVGAVRLGFAWSGFFDARAVRAGTYSGTHGAPLVISSSLIAISLYTALANPYVCPCSD